MSTPDSIKAQIQNLIGIANEKTGNADTDLTSAVNALVSGYGQSGGENPLLYASSVRFYASQFPKDYDLEIEFLDLTKETNQLTFQGSKGLRSLKLIYKGEQCIKSFSAMFNASASGANDDDYDLKFIDLREFNVLSNNYLNFCMDRKGLTEIKGELDLSASAINTNIFTNCVNLVEVRFKEGTIKLNLQMISNPLLSDESIQSIVDGLAQVETAQTLKLHAGVKAKLTETQISQITSKNWTLA